MFTVLLTGCKVTPTQATIITVDVTREVTRIIEISTTPMVKTLTPEKTRSPLSTCFEKYYIQLEINSCIKITADETKQRLIDLILIFEKQISVTSSVDGKRFRQVQTEWADLVDEKCDYLYGQVITDPNTGSLRYRNGTMAPAMVFECEINEYEQQIQELLSIYGDY